MITLHGGPWNRRKIDDLGTVTIRMFIATRYTTTVTGTKKVAHGAQVGSAVYEFCPWTEERTEAFWLENEWTGTCVSNGDDSDYLNNEGGQDGE